MAKHIVEFVLFFALLFTSVAGLDCTASSAAIPASNRVACRGAFAGISNVECASLGCCFNSSTVHVPWCFKTSVAPSLSISNPGLKYLGFFGQPSPDQCSFVPDVQSTFANFGSSETLATLAAGAARGMLGLYKVQNHVVQKHWAPDGSYAGKNLTWDFRERWAAVAAQLDPWVANGTIRGFHIGDELCWNGMPFSQLSALVTLVASTSWSSLPAGELILYYNEAQGPIVRGIDSFGQPSDFAHVPIELSWISFDFYNPGASVVRAWYEDHLYPKMAQHQYAVLVPGASSSAHRTAPSGWTVADMTSRAYEYFSWAATDPTGKVVGLNPWHWTTVNFTGGYWELGVESIPELRSAYTEIGEAILANDAVPRIVV